MCRRAQDQLRISAAVGPALSTHESSTTTNICAFFRVLGFPPKPGSLGGMGFLGFCASCGYDDIWFRLSSWRNAQNPLHYLGSCC
jgi:hypothetical protein